jgi:hypothetical protein
MQPISQGNVVNAFGGGLAQVSADSGWFGSYVPRANVFVPELLGQKAAASMNLDFSRPYYTPPSGSLVFSAPQREIRTAASSEPRRQSGAEVSVLGEWDGYVEAIRREYFVGRMRGLRGIGVVGKDEEAEIPISDVDEADKDLLVPGGYFRLMVCYERPRVGQKRKFTQIIFRRLPAYTKREIDAAEREADEIENAFRLAPGRHASGL